MSVTQAQFEQAIEDVLTKAGASAYLASSSTVTTTVADTWYPIAGTFTNDFEGFVFDTDHIKYTGVETFQFEIDWHASLASDTAATVFHIAVKKNTTVEASQKMGGALKNTTEYLPCSGTTVVELSTNDEIQLVCQSDKAGAELAFEHFNATINKFYQSRV